MATLCGVCQEQPSKYKCPTCEIPYCSLACSKAHKVSGHEQENLNSTPVKTGSNITKEPLQRAPLAPTLDEQFKALADSTEFKELVARYPGLKSRLKTIYDATLEPPSSGLEPSDSWQRGRGGYRGRSRGRFESRSQGPWSQRKGEDAALRILRRAREFEHGDGVNEFISLVQAKCGRLAVGTVPRMSEEYGAI